VLFYFAIETGLGSADCGCSFFFTSCIGFGFATGSAKKKSFCDFCSSFGFSTSALTAGIGGATALPAAGTEAGLEPTNAASA
jgi:predicted histidine transporter YuiF (NhaC family)